jgi:Icc protein
MNHIRLTKYYKESMMEIITLKSNITQSICYKAVAPGGNRIIDKELPVFIGSISKLSEGLQGIIVTSDLQGKVVKDQGEVLLGEVLGETLALYIEIELRLDPKKFGVVLCGDLFAILEKRGGLGDVRNVWNKFNDVFKWVVGVAGNHDAFGSKEEFEEFKNKVGINYLHNETKQLNNLVVAGISGIIGSPDKVNRIEESTYIEMVKKLLKENPDMLLLHQPPDNPIDNLVGNGKVRDALEVSTPTLVFCGHKHWKQPLTKLSNGTQVLNVDSRVVILINSDESYMMSQNFKAK